MKSKIILIVENHPLIIDSYIDVIEQINLESDLIQYRVRIANNYNEALLILEELKKNLTIVILGICLPKTKNEKFLSGEDFGTYAKNSLLEIKLIIITSINDNYRIYNLLKNTNPNCLLLKADVSKKEVKRSILKVIDNKVYYSDSVLKLMRSHISNDYILDRLDRQLLYELSIGTKMKELPKILAMSLAVIEKRKRFFKEMFDAEGKSDRGLILKAMEKGFI